MFLCLATLVGFSYGTSHDKLSLMNLPGLLATYKLGCFFNLASYLMDRSERNNNSCSFDPAL
jgi:hypothetical protein